MKTKFLIFVLTALSLSCTPENNEPRSISGCLDKNSLSYNSMADVDNGSCRYSKITFFAKYNLFQNVPITKIDIFINGDLIGSINNGFIWPNGPGNCSSTGTVQFEFLNSNSVDWNAKLYLANGQILSTGGSKSPNGFSDCMKTNVTI